MAEIHKILMVLVKEVLSKHDVYYTKPQSPILAEKDIKIAITNATKQIKAQERGRVKMLKMLLEDMTDLHAEDCKEDECVNILAARKYLKELEAE